MRINEIASSEEQLALWKLISDNIWTAINQQAEAERKQRAKAAAEQKLKSKLGGKRGRRKSLPPPPPFTPPPPQAKTAVGTQAYQQIGLATKQPQSTDANSAQANALASQSKAVSKQLAQSNPTNPQAALADNVGAQAQAAQNPMWPQQLRFVRQNARNVAKNSAAVKKR
jgi:hypothetical protein